MFAGVAFARRFVDAADVDGLVVFAGAVRVVLFELVFDFVVVVLPPAGWADAMPAEPITAAATTHARRIRVLIGFILDLALYAN